MSRCCGEGDSSLVTAVRFWNRCLRRSMRGICPSEQRSDCRCSARNSSGAARGEAVASCQLISTGTRDAEHRSDLGDGEHQRQFVVACVGGVLHYVRPFLMHRAADPSRTACAELVAVLLHVRPQIVGVRERFLRPHEAGRWCSLASTGRCRGFRDTEAGSVVLFSYLTFCIIGV